MEEEPDPREEFVKKMEEIQKEMEKVVERNTPPFQPFQPYHPAPNPYNAKCHCGNDGTQPCWSTACPQRIVISYGTSSGYPSFNPTWTVSTTIHNINKNENNDQ